MTEGARTLHCRIVNAERSIFDGQASFVSMRGTLGELGILPGHTPLITALAPGTVGIRTPDGEEESFYVSGGVAQVLPQGVTLLADCVQRAEELDEQRIEQAQQEAQHELHGGTAGGSVDYAQALIKLAEATAQLRLLRDARKDRR